MLEALRWEVLPHVAYLPDLASSDYHLKDKKSIKNRMSLDYILP